MFVGEHSRPVPETMAGLRKRAVFATLISNSSSPDIKQGSFHALNACVRWGFTGQKRADWGIRTERDFIKRRHTFLS